MFIAAFARLDETPGTPAPPPPTTPPTPSSPTTSSTSARSPSAPRSRTGWGPQHISIRDRAGKIAAVAPLYLKSHSQGEYVFDHSWADAYERAGGRYYPKLIAASPFSPVTGPRLLVRQDVDREEGRQLLVSEARSRSASAWASRPSA